jgi:hypothetical protein
VQREITALWGEKKVVLRQTPRAVTPFGGLSVFIAFLQKIGYRQQLPRPQRLVELHHQTLPETLEQIPNRVVGGGGGATVCAHGAAADG